MRERLSADDLIPAHVLKSSNDMASSVDFSSFFNVKFDLSRDLLAAPLVRDLSPLLLPL